VLDLALKLARFEALTPDGWRTLAKVLPAYDSLANKELVQAAAKYLQFDRSAWVWALPGRKRDGERVDEARQRRNGRSRNSRSRRTRKGRS